MKRTKLAVVLGMFILSTNASASIESPGQVNVDHLQPRLATEIEKHAAEGNRSLARYMERTRFVNRLWFDDVTRPREETSSLDRKVAMREFRKHAVEYR